MGELLFGVGAVTAMIGGERLPGSGLSIEEAAKRSHIIVVAEIAGQRLTGSSRGVTVYTDVKLKPSRSLRGRSDIEVFSLYSLAVRDRVPIEEPPRFGEEYIFFIRM